MKFPEEATCGVCKRIFCCANCRQKHELKNHATAIAKKKIEIKNLTENLDNFFDVSCPICDNKPFPLHEDISTNVLEHIRVYHLPLHCRKCSKVYTEVDDLREFSKCIRNTNAQDEKHCIPVSGLELKNPAFAFHKMETHQNISTQTSPILGISSGNASITPMSIINMRWKAKTSKITQDITDSVSSIKNLSIISHSSSLRRSLGSVVERDTKGNLVRSTSTPVHAELNRGKQKEQTFNASEGQVSSIHNSGSEIEQQQSNHSPTVPNCMFSGLPPQVEAANLYKKVNNRTKVAAVTPLRHVMSKSIQKAIAEHRKPGFSEQKLTPSNDIVSATSPLDLRLSPALRRCQSPEKQSYLKKKIQSQITQNSSPKRSNDQKVTTESVVYTCTQQVSTFQATKIDISNSDMTTANKSNNTIYKTCESIEFTSSIEASKLKIVDENNDEICPLKLLHQTADTNCLVPITPITRQSGAMLTKKIIKFETPKVENNFNCKSLNEDKYYTPISSPKKEKNSITSISPGRSEITTTQQYCRRHFSPSRRPSIRECAQSTAYSHYESDLLDDEVFFSATTVDIPDEKEKSGKAVENGGFLRSLMNTVMRLPSSSETEDRKFDFGKKKSSIIKRCASIAGSLVRSTSLVDDEQLQSLKRKRTYTIDCQQSPHKPICQTDSLPYLDATTSGHQTLSTKRFRIQGRKPIERMRINT